ncbi:MAG TPA: RidA family protein [Xanthobacteraceae bacterium]|nr:RidA family protein [Xanthobacteraceae bacterium]
MSAMIPSDEHRAILARLAAIDVAVAPYREPASRYVPALRTGNLLYFSGQLSAMEYDGEVVGFTGQLGGAVDVAAGQRAARHCAVGLLGRALVALGDLGRVRQVVRLTGYINSAPGFNEQHKVLDGCSDVLMAAFGPAGRHTRLAIGVAGLSFDTSVEVDCVLEVA